MIDIIYKIFKQKFCKHNWKTESIWVIVNDYGSYADLEERHYRICTKCNKIVKIK